MTLPLNLLKIPTFRQPYDDITLYEGYAYTTILGV